MYFQIKQRSILLYSTEVLICVRSSSDRALIACCSKTSLDLWRAPQSVRIFRYQRSEDSMKEYGENMLLCWRNDGTGIAVVTNTGCVILFEVKPDSSMPFAYQCVDIKMGYKLHDTVGAFPSFVLDPVAVVDTKEDVTNLSSINNNLMIFTTASGLIKQFVWDGGSILEDVDSKVSHFLFTDPNQYSYTPDDDLYITSLCFSQTLDIASVTFSNGRAAYLASNDNFKPGTVHALLAPSLANAVCSSINPRYHLIVFGTDNGEVFVYVLNYDNGLLNFSHKLTSYLQGPDGSKIQDKSRIMQIFWSPDGCGLCSSYQSGNLVMWSVFGNLLYSCSLDVKQGCWESEGYNLWAISGVNMLKIPFLKSPLTVNSVSNNQHHIILQSANQVYILPNQFPTKCGMSVYGSIYEQEAKRNKTAPYESFISSLGSPLENWPWQVIKVPDVYSNVNSPIRYVAIGTSGQCTAVAGLRGFAFYISAKHRWRCFGNEAQEQSMTVRGGMLWWRGVLIVACYYPEDKRNCISMYPHHASIDQTSVVATIPIPASIITMNTYDDYLVVVTGTSRVLLFLLHMTISPSLCVEANHQKVLEFSIAKFTPQPSAVLSIHVSPLLPDASVPSSDIKSILVNVAGKLLMFEIPDNGDMGKPITIATNVESVSCPAVTGEYLAAALWLNCGVRGLRVWLPLHGPEGDLSSRRILLPLSHNVYPLVVHHAEAAVLGIPLDTLKCRSETFLHTLLHELVVQNLANHAYSIAQTCNRLPYFHHTLELMIHKALESDVSNDNGIPENPVLPHIIRFMRLLPHYLSAVAHCARKTEMTQWQYLFQHTGHVQDLLDQCLAKESLDTAILYLVILQNLQPLHVSRVYILQLLEMSIEQKRWDLGVDLLRFLNVISSETEQYPKRKLTGPTDFGIRLRRSSESFDEESPVSPTTPVPENVTLAMLTTDIAGVGDKKISKRIIAYHAHKLLASCQFTSLGQMSYFLKFDLFQFFINERNNLSEIVDPVHVFMSIHEEFSWPYPDSIPQILDHPRVSTNISVITLPFNLESSEVRETVDVASDSNSFYEDSVYSECRVEIDPNILAQVLKRGTAESESRITFFLDLFVSAEVHNYALLFALTLRDVDAILNIIKQNPSSTLLSYLMAIDCWGHEENGGYALFLQSLKPLIEPLFPTSINDLKLKPLVKINSLSSINSASSHEVTKREQTIREVDDLDLNNLKLSDQNCNNGYHGNKEMVENNSGCAMS